MLTEDFEKERKSKIAEARKQHTWVVCNQWGSYQFQQLS